MGLSVENKRLARTSAFRLEIYGGSIAADAKSIWMA